jgi:hypothetical protein
LRTPKPPPWQWCKGRKNLAHKPELIIDFRVMPQRHLAKPCYLKIPDPVPKSTWQCFHKVVCAVCNKVLNPAPLCPDRRL